MKNEPTNKKRTTKKLNSSQSYNQDKNMYFIYYMAGVIVLAVFLNLAVNIKSTDEYYEKYYVLEDYVNNYEETDDEEDLEENDNDEDEDQDVDISEESNDILNEDEGIYTENDIDINEGY